MGNETVTKMDSRDREVHAIGVITDCAEAKNGAGQDVINFELILDTPPGYSKNVVTSMTFNIPADFLKYTPWEMQKGQLAEIWGNSGKLDLKNPANDQPAQLYAADLGGVIQYYNADCSPA